MSGLGSKLFVSCVLLLQAMPKCASFDYADALTKSILFFEAQRSGRLPPNQRVTWRANSGLKDGQAAGVDLEGGYYDAGDNVKFGMPMAYTITMLSWSAVAYRLELQNAQQLGYVLDAIKWGTDYLIKAHPEPNVLYGEVGDGSTDHECWQRPEDMTTPRLAYRVDSRNPGSDLAGETAAAMAAASMAFRHSDTSYSTLLLHHARQLFTFADTYRGKYDNSIQVAQKFYASRSGYMDELLWSAMWLYEATRESYYLAYVANNAKALGGTGWSMTEFSWDVKFSGVQILASKVLLEGKGQEYASTLEKYQEQAEFFLCACLQKNYGAKVQRTPGGLMFVRSWNNIQYVTSASFLLTVYSDYLSSSRQQLNCHGTKVEAYELLNLAKSQIDYILGNNPRATSYMVGFGGNYPRHIHHRASSIISYKVDSSFVSCRGGYATWYTRKENDPNVLVGALVGGPDQNDNFADQRENYEQTEPATYNNGPIVGVLARLLTFRSYNQPLQAISSSSLPAHVEQKSAAVQAKARGSQYPRSTMLVTQRLLTSWIHQNRTYHKYEATITNRAK